MRVKTLAELAGLVDGQVIGKESCLIEGVATLASAGPNQIAFLANPRYREFLPTTQAGAVIVASADVEQCRVNALVVKDPYLSYAKIATVLAPSRFVGQGVESSAVVAASAQLATSAYVGANAVVGAAVVIGERVYIGPGCIIGEGCRIGADTRLVAKVTLCHEVSLGARVLIHPGAVIGSDGFGIANDRGRWIKVPQLGRVLIGDDVEIGANSAIDRGALEDTIIAEGVKLDNLVHIAHNVKIGAHTVVAGCVGIAGSTEIGHHCAIAGGVGITGHIRITDNVQITGMAMVTKSIPEPGVYSSGIPAQSNIEWRKSVARFRRLDELTQKVKALEEALHKRG